MHLIDYIIVGFYLLEIVLFGIFIQRKASAGRESYFLDDRKIPWWVLGASGMASNTDIAGTMLITSLIYALGTKGFFIEIRGGIVLIMAMFMIFMGKWGCDSLARNFAGQPVIGDEPHRSSFLETVITHR